MMISQADGGQSPMSRSRPLNNTVKLSDALAERVLKAMQVEGTEAFAEFARTALTEKCRRIESELLRTNPKEYQIIYGDPDDLDRDSGT